MGQFAAQRLIQVLLILAKPSLLTCCTDIHFYLDLSFGSQAHCIAEPSLRQLWLGLLSAPPVLT